MRGKQTVKRQYFPSTLSALMVVQILIIVAQWVDSVGMWTNNFRNIRYCQLFAISPTWLIHNILVFSIGGIITEIFTIISTVIALLRFRKSTEDSNQ